MSEQFQLDEQNLTEAAATLKALADPNRVALLALLGESRTEMTVSQLGVSFPVDLSVVSSHLAALREAGILEVNMRGRHVFYRVRIQELAALLRGLADALEA